MSINNKNLVIITTTLPNNKISQKRKNNLIYNFKIKYKVPIIFNQGKKEKNKFFFELLKKRMETFIKSDFEYGILCDDDFFPIKNFMKELNETVKLLPDKWECLHLCPGFLWGRRFRDMSKIGKLNPIFSMKNIPYHKSGRYYLNCKREIYYHKKFWLGGPIAMLVNKKSIKKILFNYIKMFNFKKRNNDVILTKILNNYSFICRQPQLGFEFQCGGGTNFTY